MQRIELKAFSVNQSYCVKKGQIAKTKERKQYDHDLFYLMPRIKVPRGKLRLVIEFGVSNCNCDADNFVKPFQDTLALRNKFNDKIIYKVSSEKIDVKKGDEYIKFSLESLEVEHREVGL